MSVRGEPQEVFKVEIQPEYLYSLSERKVFLLGDFVLEQVIAIHPYIEVLADKQKFSIGTDDVPDELTSLKRLITTKSAIPDTFKSERNRYGNLSNERVLQYARWLTYVVDKGNEALSKTVIDRTALLGLGMSSTMIRDPDRFGKITNLQKALGQEHIRETGVGNMNEWDIAAILREIGLAEGRVPTADLITSRSRRNGCSPHYEALRYYGVSLRQVNEMAGYLNPRIWNRNKFGEWGHLFWMANGRIFTLYELGLLAALGKGPSPTGSSLKIFGSCRKYQTFVKRYNDARHKIKTESINEGLRSGVLPKNIIAGLESEEQLVRRTARFRVIKSLFPELPDKTYIGLSQYDVKGQDFIKYINAHGSNSHGRPRPDWMFESAAWKYESIPELFPDGNFVNSLKLGKARGTVF